MNELARRLMARLDHLATFTDEPGRLTRLYLTPAHKAAARVVLEWMTEAGMNAGIDAIGNVVGRLEAAQPDRPTVLLGSHIDTIRNAGRYDGNLGVVAAIAAVERLQATGGPLPFAIEVVAFGDEEGVRFPVTLSGSRALAGTFDSGALEAVDAEGVSLARALDTFGGQPEAIASLGRPRGTVAAYIELHIEQGPVLEHEQLPVGVVTAIAGASRLLVSVTGTAGHAGTVPMALRRDAGAAAAAMVLEVERLGRDLDVVATVGSLTFEPGAVNVIPGQARFTVDLRSERDVRRLEALRHLEAQLRRIADERDVGIAIHTSYDQAACPCADWLIEQMAEAVERQGVRSLRLTSGAGHDGLALASLCPIGMLFVRCAGGISHHPAEAISGDDAALATLVLVDLLRNLKLPVAS